MKFRTAVKNTVHLRDAWRPGLEALRSRDKRCISPDNTRKLSGSVDIDAALQAVEPNANRWDYAIGYRHTNRTNDFVYWVETHTGSDSQIGVVLRKLEWLKGWLRGDGRNLAGFEREFVWVPSGATSFTQGSTQVKQLATQGLRYSGSVFRIADSRPDPDPSRRRR